MQVLWDIPGNLHGEMVVKGQSFDFTGLFISCLIHHGEAGPIPGVDQLIRCVRGQVHARRVRQSVIGTDRDKLRPRVNLRLID